MASPPGSNRKLKQLIQALVAGKLQKFKKLGKAMDDGRGLAETFARIIDSFGRGILHIAAVKGGTNICKYLLEDLKLLADEKDIEECTPLLHASLEGHLDTVKYLINHGADPAALNKHNTTALHLAASGGKVEVIPVLLSTGADVNAPSDIGTPLQVAAQECDIEVLKMLLDNGANPNLHIFIPSPLDFCIYRSLECTKLLIQRGANPNGSSCGMTPLASAAKKGDIDVINCLLESGADPDITNDIGLKPIEIAAQKGNYRELKALFPITERIPTYSDWSIPGIIKHVHSEEFLQQIQLRNTGKYLKAISKAEDAVKKNNFVLAAVYFAEAISANPSNAEVYSGRSHCFTCLGHGASALADAAACIDLLPNWSKGYYRAGLACAMLNRLDLSAEALRYGLIVAPNDTVLRKCYKLALKKIPNTRSFVEVSDLLFAEN